MKGRRVPLPLYASQHTLPTQSQDHLLWGWRDPHSPTEGYGVELSLEVCFTLSSLSRHLFQKKKRYFFNTHKWAVLIYFPHDYTYFPLQIRISNK